MRFAASYHHVAHRGHDTIAEAVLAREDVARFLEGSHGLTSDTARTRVMAYLEELRTTQRYELYRALEYPLYPILRKIERVGENQQFAVDAAAKGRVVYASNHRSHIDYLVEPLVLDDAGIRPPIIAAGINLFGGPLGLIHKHVTGALPIRRNMKDPAYLITLKAYVSELLHKHDLFFYPEGGRSYSGELKAAKTGLVQRVPRRRRAGPEAGAGRGGVRPGARGSRHREAGSEAAAEGVQPRDRRAGALRGGLSQPRVRHVRQADSARRHRRRITKAVMDLARHVRREIGKLYKVLPTAVLAAAMTQVDVARRARRRASTGCSTRCARPTPT